MVLLLMAFAAGVAADVTLRPRLMALVAAVKAKLSKQPPAAK